MSNSCQPSCMASTKNGPVLSVERVSITMTLLGRVPWSTEADAP